MTAIGHQPPLLDQMHWKFLMKKCCDHLVPNSFNSAIYIDIDIYIDSANCINNRRLFSQWFI